MFKFMRKYMKWILAVGGVLLMIVFLIPQAITSLSQRAARGSAVWATVGPDNENVPAAVLRQCRRELEVLEQLQRAGVDLGLTDSVDHWYLLTREAELAGLSGGNASDQIPASQLQQLQAVVGGRRELDTALAKTFAISRMKEMHLRSARLSDNRMRAKAERLFHAVDGRAVIIEASDDNAAEPTEAELVAQWEAYKDVSPTLDAPTGDEPGYGYKLPDRLKIEWLRISTDSIREMVEGSGAVDQVALFKHWKRYATDTTRNYPAFESGVPIPDIVREDLISDLVDETREKIRRFAKDRFLGTQRRLRRTDEGYYALPDDWSDQRVALQDLATQIQNHEAFAGLPLPAYQSIADRWLTLDDLGDYDDLSNAGSEGFGPQPVTTTMMVSAAKEFAANPAVLIQEGIASPNLTDTLDGSLLFFRITATDPSRAAHDVSEVRDAVATDLRRKTHYEQLVAMVPTLEATARDQGLLTLAMEHGSEVRNLSRVTLYTLAFVDFQLRSGRLAPIPTPLPVLGADLDTIGAIVDLALALGDDTPLRDLPAEQRTFVLPVNNRNTLMVVELTGQQGLDTERYTQLATSGALQNVLLAEEMTTITDDPDETFSFEALRERHNFIVLTRDGDPATSAPDDADDAPEEDATDDAN